MKYFGVNFFTLCTFLTKGVASVFAVGQINFTTGVCCMENRHSGSGFSSEHHVDILRITWAAVCSLVCIFYCMS